MSSVSYRRQVQQHQQQIAKLQRDKARETDRIADSQRRLGRTSQALARATSESTVRSTLGFGERR